MAVAALFALLPLAADAYTLTRQIDAGMTGADVTALQEYLAQDSTIYPEGLVTGYFGSITEAAVKRFQTRNGLSAVGRVGPLTLSALNSKMWSVSSSDNMTAPAISNNVVSTNRSDASVRWNTNELARGLVYYSEQPLNLTEYLHYVAVSGGNASMSDMGMRLSQDVSLQNLSTNTTYYYMIYSTDQDGNVSVSWPDTFRTTN
jgi:peptidoglycan hydrolase-like protein with peptidoglycan-binding domain